MKTIIITVHDDDPDRIAVEVDVSGDFTTPEAIGYIEIAKSQHLSSKHQGPLTVVDRQEVNTHG